MTRIAELQTLVDRLATAFAKAEVSAPGRAALQRVFGRLAISADFKDGPVEGDTRSQDTPMRHFPSVPASEVTTFRPQGIVPGDGAAESPFPVTALFHDALVPLIARSDALAPLAKALQALGPHLVWNRRKLTVPNASEGFAEAHANAMLIGPQGLEVRDDVQIGLSLMAPGTRYPDHTHPPEEVYIVLCDGAFLQNSPPWLPRAAGQTVYNPPGILHAMRAADTPFLALWCLPV